MNMEALSVAETVGTISAAVSTPVVSILITVRNMEAYISETLASLLKEQEIPLEIILIDNGCTDRTILKAMAFQDDRIRVVEGPRKGISHALNVGYRVAQGEIIMRCDGDDLFPPGRIARQVAWLNDHPEFGVVCSGFATMDSKGNHLVDLSCDLKEEEITTELQNGVTRTHIGTFAMRAEVVKAAGYSREYFDCFEDVDFQLRLGETCRVWFLPEVAYQYRLHSTSVTHSNSEARMRLYDSIAREFQQQRKTRGQDDLQLGCPPPIPQMQEKSFATAKHVQGMLMGTAWLEHKAGHKQRALLLGLRAVFARPNNMEAWRSLLALAIKPAGQS